MGFSRIGFVFLLYCFIIFSLNFSKETCCQSIQRKRNLCRLNRKKLACVNSNSFNFIWEIKRSSPSPPAYLFGTIHVPYTKVWDSIPQIAKDAFNSSDRIIFELDMLNDLTHTRLSNCQLLPSGIKLADIVPKNLYIRLKHHLEYVRSKIPMWMSKHHKYSGLLADQLFKAKTENWERKRPIWVMMLLNSLTENDIKSQGIPVLDLYLAYEARHLNKEIGSVERAKDQCVPLNRLNFTQALFALNQTLLQHESIRRGTVQSGMTTDELIRHYNCGNLNEVIFNQDTAQLPFLKDQSYDISSDEFEISKQIDDYFRTQLIINRNKRMSKQIIQILDSSPRESLFFAFGAGHFIGKDSIVELLQEKGLEIVHINHIDSYTNVNCSPDSMQQKLPLPSSTQINEPFVPISPTIGDRASIPPPRSSSSSSSSSANIWFNDFLRQYNAPSRHHHPYPNTVKPANMRDSPSMGFPFPSVPYGQNPWPSSSSSSYAPRYLRLVANASRVTFNDLLVRAYIVNNNLPISNTYHGSPYHNHHHHYHPQQWTKSHLPAYRTDHGYLLSSSRVRSKYHSWPTPMTNISPNQNRPLVPGAIICLIICVFSFVH